MTVTQNLRLLTFGHRVKFNFFFDRCNAHQELGKEHVTSLKINCVLGEKREKKNLSRGVFNRLQHINLSVNFTLHIHEIR